MLGLPLQKFDPYALPAPLPPTKKSGMSVSLNGANYVSDATQQDFENSMNDGFKVNNTTPSPNGSRLIPAAESNTPAPVISADSNVTNSLQAEKPAAQIDTETVKQRPANISTMSKQPPPSNQSFTSTQVMETLERSLSGFYQHQNETLQVHQQFLDQKFEILVLLHPYLLQ